MADHEENSTHASTDIFIDEAHLRAVVITLLVVGAVATIPTAYIRWQRNRLRELECAFLLSGLIFFITYEVVLLKVMPLVYQISYFGLGMYDKAPPPTLDNIRDFVTLMFVSSLMSWSLLWSIKASLLVFYRRLMIGLPHHLRWWNVVLAYTIITYLYTMITTFTSCGGPINFHRDVQLFCARPGDNLTRNLSFYGAFASDVSSDLLIMFLPMRLIWKLQMSIQRKIAVGAMFSVGSFVIVAAIVRLVQIDKKTGSLNPNSQWLTLWGTVEATTAMIVGCLPTFRFFRKTSSSTQQGYSRSGGWYGSRTAKSANQIPLHDYSTSSNHRHVTAVYGGPDTSSSRESLAPKMGVLVTTQHRVESERWT
ncbi:hypothetical protein VTO42DRAFT_2182 [Malbranchea cinnamomea]